MSDKNYSYCQYVSCGCGDRISQSSYGAEAACRFAQKWQKTRETGGKLQGEVTELFSKEQFCTMVERAKEHIHEGNIFQIVLSNRLSVPFEGSLLNTYRILRTINPSPYMFYFPEQMLKLQELLRKHL